MRFGSAHYLPSSTTHNAATFLVVEDGAWRVTLLCRVFGVTQRPQWKKTSRNVRRMILISSQRDQFSM